MSAVTRKTGRCALGRMLSGLAVCCLLASGPAIAQGPPLSEELKASFSSNVMAFQFHPIATGAHADDLSAAVTFDTAKKVVSIDWWYAVDGAEYGTRHDDFTVSFEPTAVCPRAGSGPTLYIAGYIQRTGHTVIEEWTFENIVLGSALPQGGTQGKSTFSKTVRKEVIVNDAAVLPLRYLVYHYARNRLWAAEDSDPFVVWEIDVDSGARTHLADKFTWPELPLLLSARAGKVKSTAPDGGGFIVQLFKTRCWKPKSATGELKPTDQLYIIRDVNLDGVAEEAGVITFANLGSRQYGANDDPLYHP